MVPSLFQSNMNSFVLPPSRYQNNTLRTYPTVNNPTTYPLNYTLSTESNDINNNIIVTIYIYILMMR